MKNKILLVSVLATILVIAGNTYAVGQNSNNGTGNQAPQQTSASNQDEDNQTQTQTQQQLQDKSGEGNQVQNQNQEKNQGETNQIQNQEQKAVERRSNVANAVQEMLKVADRNGGIGQQVRTIAQAQNQNQEKLEESLQKVQSRSGLAKFFVGPNYGEINSAKEILEQNREQIQQLNQIKNQLINWSDQQQLTEQVQLIEQANIAIENSLNASQKGFSLLGWLFRAFSK